MRWFRIVPPGFEGRSAYTTATRLAVLSMVVEHKMNFEAASNLSRVLLNLPQLASTTVLRWYRDAGGKVDYRGHIQRMADVFSGQMAIDEVYDGEYYIIKVTDPLNGVEITSRIGDGSPNHHDVTEVLQELADAGFRPQLIVTDASKIYPKALKAVFPEAEHQLCVFHYIKGVLDKMGAAFREAKATMPLPPKRRAGRPAKRGRPRKDRVKRTNRKNVQKVRYILFKRPGLDRQGRSRITETEQRRIDRALELCPPLGPLRRFALALYELFGPTTNSPALAEERRRTILSNPEFGATESLRTFLKRLSNEQYFAQLIRYQSFENADKTSNHPERENREFRKRQKSHYRLRSIQSLCAFLDLLLVRREPPRTPRRLTRRPEPIPTSTTNTEAIAA